MNSIRRQSIFSLLIMIEYKDQTFRKLYDRGNALCLQDIYFQGCTFDGCALSLTKDVHLRSTVRNVHLKIAYPMVVELGLQSLRALKSKVWLQMIS